MLKYSNFDLKIEEYMLYCSSRNLSPKTLKSYETTLKLFSNYLVKEHTVDDVEDVTKNHIRHYVKFLQERGKYTCMEEKGNNKPSARTDFGKPISVNTINNYVRNIKVFFNWLADEDEIEKNPMLKIKLLKGSERIKAMLSEKEIKSILNSFNKTIFNEYRNYIITLVILDTGCRISECLEIKVDDVNLTNQVVVLRYTKNKKERPVFFSPKLKKELNQWLKYKDRYMTNDLLFPTNRGTLLAINLYEKALRKIGNELKIELYPHKLRANFAQYYLLNGGDILTLSRILGHSNLEVTKVYLQFDDESVNRQYQKFSPLNGLNLR
ncbi:site-specific integrase [Desulfosporosinus fructosivorans]|uniref:Site-specific integrase n=1 Tax=Desulfosporosinus fructosivorans TaxID=2018669 RepID=A0A4Z0R6N4_9FIRM|nr:tyrosine-type recombinase/integrase [Desulfosporosinus fructosivorans]TGE38712.1 site-specific integrase [Desulfosporosinus fructosivorans]